MKVELVDSMGDDLRVANIARVSFAKWKEEFDAGDAKLIDYLANHGHSSPFRHTCISLRCKAPIFIARQLGKHQVGLTWNEVSRRYVGVGIEFFFPEEWRSRPDKSIKQGSGAVIEDEGTLTRLYDLHLRMCLCQYEDMLRAGVAPEQARMVLPQSMMTEWVWTGSLPAFFHVYKLRIDPHAQKEVQDFAIMLNDIVEPLFPHCWSALKGDSNETTTN